MKSHAGVIFGDLRTVPPHRAGIVAAALTTLINEIGEADTTNLVRYLRPRPR